MRDFLLKKKEGEVCGLMFWERLMLVVSCK